MKRRETVLWALKGFSAAAACALALVVLLDSEARPPASGVEGPRFAARDGWMETVNPAMARQRFASPKPPGTFRVFLAGNSVMMGYPYVSQLHSRLTFLFGRFAAPQAGGIATWLAPYLQAAWPDRRVEVVNAAMGGLDMAATTATVREILETGEPDVIVILDEKASLSPMSERRHAALYREQLSALRRLTTAARVRTYVTTVPFNEKGWPPYEPEARAEWRLGKRLVAEGRSREAAPAFARARARSRFARMMAACNGAMRRLPRSPYWRTIDLDAELRAASADGAVGSESFHDQTHMRLPGYQASARIIAGALAAEAPARAREAMAAVRLRPLPVWTLKALYLARALQWLRLSVGGAAPGARETARGYLGDYAQLEVQIRLLEDGPRR